MILVGITGPIGHGKSTLASALQQSESNSQVIETSEVINEVVNDLNHHAQQLPQKNDLSSINEWLSNLSQILPKVIHQRINWSRLELTNSAISAKTRDYIKLFEYIDSLHANPQLLHQNITETNKKDYRSMQQWLGGYLVTHLDADIWYSEILRRSKIASKNGLMLYVVGGVRFLSDADCMRKAGARIVAISRPDVTISDIDDPTERERAQIRPDSTVINNGSLSQLNNTARQLWSDLLADQLRPEYRTNDLS